MSARIEQTPKLNAALDLSFPTRPDQSEQPILPPIKSRSPSESDIKKGLRAGDQALKGLTKMLGVGSETPVPQNDLREGVLAIAAVLRLDATIWSSAAQTEPNRRTELMSAAITRKEQSLGMEKLAAALKEASPEEASLRRGNS